LNFTLIQKSKLTILPRDWWLYDTRSSRHISNNKALFKDLIYLNDLPTIVTGAGPVQAEGIGSIQLPFYYHKVRYVTLNNVLYIPEFPINIVSGQQHYRNGGIISGETLLSAEGIPFTKLDLAKRGFFLNIAYKPEPDLAILAIDPEEYLSKIQQIQEPISQPTRLLIDRSSDQPTTKSINKQGENREFSHYTATDLWHRRLGHPSYPILVKTAKVTKGIPERTLNKEDLNCEACISGKFTR